MKKAFTIIELLTAVGLLAMVITFAGLIFKVSIEGQRTASANAEIMGKLRAITDQLNVDFKGIRTDAPILIWFEQNPDDPNQRYDQIMFFADGDFQSIQPYDGSPGEPADTGEPISGSVARIHYGQAQPDPNLLARRQHILTADPALALFDMSNFDENRNERYEHDSLSLSQWQTVQAAEYDTPIIPTCFDYRPLVNTDDRLTYHKLICEGVGSFAIQCAYWDLVDDALRWYPSDDPDNDGDDSDTDFNSPSLGDIDIFGNYFNVPDATGPTTIDHWEPISTFYPNALRFTFRLYDSRGVLKGGRRFTHIVYLGD